MVRGKTKLRDGINLPNTTVTGMASFGGSVLPSCFSPTRARCKEATNQSKPQIGVEWYVIHGTRKGWRTLLLRSCLLLPRERKSRNNASSLNLAL
mmetsp:Transcript_10825/g.22928  ORF Transcript_10825/g.22928 Transcript_10825/m.22928 type:complete len:95 (-) Transcript_10825:405-689(-)